MSPIWKMTLGLSCSTQVGMRSSSPWIATSVTCGLMVSAGANEIAVFDVPKSSPKVKRILLIRGSALAGDEALAGDALSAAAIVDIERLRRHAHEIARGDRSERVEVVRMRGFPDELGSGCRIGCGRATGQAELLLDHLQNLFASFALGAPGQDDIGDLAQVRGDPRADIVALEGERGGQRRPDIGIGLQLGIKPGGELPAQDIAVGIGQIGRRQACRY